MADTVSDISRRARAIAAQFMQEHWALLGFEGQRFAKPSESPALATVLADFAEACHTKGRNEGIQTDVAAVLALKRDCQAAYGRGYTEGRAAAAAPVPPATEGETAQALKWLEVERLAARVRESVSEERAIETALRVLRAALPAPALHGETAEPGMVNHAKMPLCQWQGWHHVSQCGADWNSAKVVEALLAFPAVPAVPALPRPDGDPGCTRCGMPPDLAPVIDANRHIVAHYADCPLLVAQSEEALREQAERYCDGVAEYPSDTPELVQWLVGFAHALALEDT